MYKKGKDIPVADALCHVTPMDPEDNIQLPIIAVNMITTCILMSVHPQDSFSNKLDQLRKSTVQDNQPTAVTSTQDSCVTRRICLQIFRKFGTTGKHYQLNPDSLLVETGS